MVTIEVSRQQATEPDRLPRRCMRCNAPDALIVPRPVASTLSEGEQEAWSALWGKNTSKVGQMATLVLEGLARLKSEEGFVGKLLALVMFLTGLGLGGALAADFLDIGTPFFALLALLAGLASSTAALVWSAGKVSPRLVEGRSALVPVCRRHQHHWQGYQRLVVLLACVVAAYMALVAYLVVKMLSGPPGQTSLVDWISGGLFVLAALVGVAAWLVREPIKAALVDNGRVAFSGACPEYARLWSGRSKPGSAGHGG